MTHTPAPWVDGHNVSHEPTVLSANPSKDNGGFVIATFHGPNARENARLSAAAPDLLAAAKLLVSLYERELLHLLPPDGAAKALSASRSAITKASEGSL